MPLSQIDRDIIRKTLVHYFNALSKQFSAEGLPETVRVDLMKEYAMVGKARDEMNYKPRNKKDFHESYAYGLNNDDYNRVICSALNYYIQELKDSKEKIRKYHTKIPMDSIEKDLILANAALDKMTNRDKSPKT
jgi:hypothetical protein